MVLSLESLLTQSRRPRLLVAGDVMLDRYVWGDVGRISPEAPIPVLSVGRIEDRLGGAGSVASMLAALEADVTPLAVVGDDLEGRRVLELLDEAGIAAGALIPVADRPTTVKQRLLGQTQSRHPQQMIRVDRETTLPLGESTARRLLDAMPPLADVDLVMISDYGKGVCTEYFLAELIRRSRQAGVPLVADPAPKADYARYRGCTCVTPNRTEAAGALGRAIRSPADGLAAARDLLAFGVESAAVTLDRDGIAWADAEGQRRLFSVRPREVCDVTGAGDMVAAAFSYAFASGADWVAACELANLAAGLEVERLGASPLSRGAILGAIRAADPRALPPGESSKIVPLGRLRRELGTRRAAGQRVAMTNGCFDLLHPGPVASLQFARAQGDCLVVGLNSDRSVRRLKGPGRPILHEHARAEVLAALACVDYVVVFDETSVAPLVGQVLPDVLVKSAQYTGDEVVGHEIVERHGGRIVLCPMHADFSTTMLLDRIRDVAAPPDGARGKAA
jgi:D-beta-D-heptose 7-phosphate kinase / D-beta-D-heptose 1-phosphate adenosyltransferase